jgi:hypothetical protein
MNSGLQKYMLEKQIQKHIDSDLIDIHAHLDDSLTLHENIEEFKHKGLIQFDLEDYGYCEEETELWNYRQNFVCKKCGCENMNATYYADHWIVVRCECGGWHGFKGNPKFM